MLYLLYKWKIGIKHQTARGFYPLSVTVRNGLSAKHVWNGTEYKFIYSIYSKNTNANDELEFKSKVRLPLYNRYVYITRLPVYN